MLVYGITDAATTEIYTYLHPLSIHVSRPIYSVRSNPLKTRCFCGVFSAFSASVLSLFSIWSAGGRSAVSRKIKHLRAWVHRKPRRAVRHRTCHTGIMETYTLPFDV